VIDCRWHLQCGSQRRPLAPIRTLLTAPTKGRLGFHIQALESDGFFAHATGAVLASSDCLQGSIALIELNQHPLSRRLGHGLTLHGIHSRDSPNRGLIERYGLRRVCARVQSGFEIALQAF
jgi:hypothetical protein